MVVGIFVLLLFLLLLSSPIIYLLATAKKRNAKYEAKRELREWESSQKYADELHQLLLGIEAENIKPCKPAECGYTGVSTELVYVHSVVDYYKLAGEYNVPGIEHTLGENTEIDYHRMLYTERLKKFDSGLLCLSDERWHFGGAYYKFTFPHSEVEAQEITHDQIVLSVRDMNEKVNFRSNIGYVYNFFRTYINDPVTAIDVAKDYISDTKSLPMPMPRL